LLKGNVSFLGYQIATDKNRLKFKICHLEFFRHLGYYCQKKLFQRHLPFYHISAILYFFASYPHFFNWLSIPKFQQFWFKSTWDLEKPPLTSILDISAGSDHFTGKSFHRFFLTERVFTVGWPKAIWPNTIWPRGHLTETPFDAFDRMPFNRMPFDRKFIWPNRRLTERCLTESSFYRKKSTKFIKRSFDRSYMENGHLTENQIWKTSQMTFDRKIISLNPFNAKLCRQVPLKSTTVT
jgi:hypothetical protein